jgi:hypothetical protein
LFYIFCCVRVRTGRQQQTVVAPRRLALLTAKKAKGAIAPAGFLTRVLHTKDAEWYARPLEPVGSAGASPCRYVRVLCFVVFVRDGLAETCENDWPCYLCYESKRFRVLLSLFSVQRAWKFSLFFLLNCFWLALYMFVIRACLNLGCVEFAWVTSGCLQTSSLEQ